MPEYVDLFQEKNFGHSFSEKVPDGENYFDVERRVKSFLQELDIQQNQTIAIFSHFVVIRLLIKELLDLTEAETLNLAIKNTTPLIFDGKQLGKFKQLFLNN